jgi:hypothetical protein
MTQLAVHYIVHKRRTCFSNYDAAKVLVKAIRSALVEHLSRVSLHHIMTTVCNVTGRRM